MGVGRPLSLGTDVDAFPAYFVQQSLLCPSETDQLDLLSLQCAYLQQTGLQLKVMCGHRL